MRIETPDHFGGKPIPDDAIEIALAAEKNKKDGGRENQGESPSLADFIYVPSIDLHFAKERSHLGEEWYDAHIELQSKGLKMPTIPQFIEFLKHLRADPTVENTSIYDEITEKKDPWRAEWLDAKFYKKDGELWVAYNHIVDSHGDIVTQDHKKLEGHLMQDKRPGISLEHWLNNPTKQGLPQENSEQGDLGYLPPRAGGVARFFTCFVRAELNCSRNPSDYNSKLGVFACAKNAGEKQ